MDAFRFGGGDPPPLPHPQQQHQNPLWYPPPPPPPSSSSSSSPHHLPPYPLHHYPPPPHPPHHHQQQQQWHFPDRHHHFPPPPPQPYHGACAPPLPPPYAAASSHQYPPTLQNPPPQHASLPPLPPPAYPPMPPNQGWANPSWAQNQGWEYTDRNVPYSNEEEWAAKAKAWASANSATESHPTQPHVAPIGRNEEHSYAYHEQYQRPAGPPMETLHPSVPQSSNQQLPNYMMDQQKEVNHMHGTTSFSSGSSYSADGLFSHNAGGEGTVADKDRVASPQRNYISFPSIYEQEVSYSYSSTPGKKDTMVQHEGSQLLPTFSLPSVQDGFLHLPSGVPRNPSVEQSHFNHGGEPSKLTSDASYQPLDSNHSTAPDIELHQKIGYSHADRAAPVGMMNHEAIATAPHAWTPSGPSGFFPHAPLPPPVTQLDLSVVSQSSLPLHPSPLGGRIPGPSYRPSTPAAPFGGVGADISLHHSATFPADANGSFALSERPRKAAVPNWLREEILKNKSVLSSAAPVHQAGTSFPSIGSEDAEKLSRKVDQSDSKSIYSTKSTEEEEDDEDEVEAARTAAINQEIKRVLTEVLLKVTDDLFDEIATKVLHEDEPTVEAIEPTNAMNPDGSHSALLTPKAFGKILKPVETTNHKVGGSSEESSPSAPRGDILGLANYASDEDDGSSDGTQRSNMLSTEVTADALQEESNGLSSKNVLKGVNKQNLLIRKEEPTGGRDDVDNERSRKNLNQHHRNISATTNEAASQMRSVLTSDDHLLSHEKSFSSGIASSLQSREVLGGKGQATLESTGATAKEKLLLGEVHARESQSILNSGRPADKVNKEDAIKEVKDIDKSSCVISNATNSRNNEEKDRMKGRIDKKDSFKEKAEDRSGRRAVGAKDSDSRGTSKHRDTKVDRTDAAKDKREKSKDTDRKREQPTDEKEDRLRRVKEDSVRYTSKKSPPHRSRSRSNKDNSLHGHGSVSSDEPSENSKRRKLQSRKTSSSPSPTRSRKRKRRSRSSTPNNRR
ncbi:uncharacterized protein [Typha angustifolia]|uniref:uncharacterized protein isoform X2 n=1 Tax=Typha angustifolia TaxID=59011 RepID=UPI003C30D9DC